MIEISPYVYILGAMLVLTVPLNWLIAAVCAAIFHEICHILALSLSGEKVHRICIGTSGTVIETGPLGEQEELFCALAGPAGSLTLALAYRLFPRLAICAVIQGLFNLLPLWPLDGGRALRCLLQILTPQKALHVEKIIKISLLILLLFLLTWISAAYSLGILPLFLTTAICIKEILRKKPCKQGRIRVQ